VRGFARQLVVCRRRVNCHPQRAGVVNAGIGSHGCGFGDQVFIQSHNLLVDACIRIGSGIGIHQVQAIGEVPDGRLARRGVDVAVRVRRVVGDEVDQGGVLQVNHQADGDAAQARLRGVDAVAIHDAQATVKRDALEIGAVLANVDAIRHAQNKGATGGIDNIRDAGYIARVNRLGRRRSLSGASREECGK
jgi:hypothetical protein